jgi:hypothetical protein
MSNSVARVFACLAVTGLVHLVFPSAGTAQACPQKPGTCSTEAVNICKAYYKSREGVATGKLPAAQRDAWAALNKLMNKYVGELQKAPSSDNCTGILEKYEAEAKPLRAKIGM